MTEGYRCGLLYSCPVIKPNGVTHSYQLNQSISILRDDKWYFSFLFKIKIEHIVSKQCGP